MLFVLSTGKKPGSKPLHKGTGPARGYSLRTERSAGWPCPSTLQAAPGPLAGNLMSHHVRSAGDFRNAPSDGLKKQMWNVAQETLDNALDTDVACTAEQQRHTAQTP